MAERTGIVFAGPSLRFDDVAGQRLVIAPPAQRGDLLHAAGEGFQVIGLIDGLFGQSLAVTLAEIRACAEAGARLYGGASMGALRAVECPEAIQGIGAIWQAFADGILTDDDEVAVTFSPFDHALCSLPLVQVREAVRLAGIRFAPRSGVLDAYLENVRALPFSDRTLPVLRRLGHDLEAQGVAWTCMEEWLTEPQHDVKRKDALEVVRRVAQALEPDAGSTAAVSGD